MEWKSVLRSLSLVLSNDALDINAGDSGGGYSGACLGQQGGQFCFSRKTRGGQF